MAKTEKEIESSKNKSSKKKEVENRERESQQTHTSFNQVNQTDQNCILIHSCSFLSSTRVKTMLTGKPMTKSFIHKSLHSLHNNRYSNNPKYSPEVGKW